MSVVSPVAVGCVRHTVGTMTNRVGRMTAMTAAATLLATLFLTTPAWAHVTVHPQSVHAGAADIELVFRVPNERDDADTVALQVYFPADLPLASVDVLPLTGWTERVNTRTLSTPLQTDDGPVSQVVGDITWTATAGGIAPGQYGDFTVAAGRAPVTPGAVVFKALQTYSSGEIVRWIQVATSQDPQPDFPAPVLTVTAAAPASPTVAVGSGSEALAVAALVVAGLALAGVVALFVLRRRGSGPVGEPADDPPTGSGRGAVRHLG